MAEEKTTELRLQIGNRVWRGAVDASFEDAPKIPGLILQVAADKQTDVVKLDDVQMEERDRMLQDLVFQGKASKKVMIGNAVEVLLETFDGKTMLDIDSTAPGVVVPEDALRKWDLDYEMIRTLAQGIAQFDGKPIGDTRKEREEFILRLPWTMVLYLGGCWNRFMAELAILMEPDIVGDLIRK